MSSEADFLIQKRLVTALGFTLHDTTLSDEAIYCGQGLNFKLALTETDPAQIMLLILSAARAAWRIEARAHLEKIVGPLASI